MSTADDLRRVHAALRAEATALVGGLGEVARRAAVYHHVYRDSGGNHVFPLIAAHGALWAKGYFEYGRRLGWWVSWQYVGSRTRRHEQLAALDAFADAFRVINRRVCIETYTDYHFARRHGDDPAAAEVVHPLRWEAVRKIVAARNRRRELSTAEKRAAFEAFFLGEQEEVVGPAVREAVAGFDWPAMKRLALRPTIRFAYFGRRRAAFRDFSRVEERIANGLRVFDWSAELGWSAVEASLADYGLLPREFLKDPERWVENLRRTCHHS